MRLNTSIRTQSSWQFGTQVFRTIRKYKTKCIALLILLQLYVTRWVHKHIIIFSINHSADSTNVLDRWLVEYLQVDYKCTFDEDQTELMVPPRLHEMNWMFGLWWAAIDVETVHFVFFSVFFGTYSLGIVFSSSDDIPLKQTKASP